MPAEPNEANDERTRYLRLTLAALEQAQEHLHAAHTAEAPDVPDDIADTELENAQLTLKAAFLAIDDSRLHAATDRLAQEAPTTRKAADNTLIFALDTLVDCVMALLGDDEEAEDDPTAAVPQITIRTDAAGNATITAWEQDAK